MKKISSENIVSNYQNTEISFSGDCCSLLLVATLKCHQRSHTAEETPEQFDKRFIDFFNQPDIDGWLVRKGLYELHCHDIVPEPTVAAAALRACRRVNDYALAVRFLEAIKLKCGRHASKIYPYIIQELRPVLNELGISTPEEMQFDKPQLFKPSPDWWPEEYYEIYKFPKHSTYPMKYV
ncbi:Cytochrome c oxidase subunit 5A [Trichinella spiralis]|uniref:Cytochrome c oxidase subunit 5A, mitochondrial n=1 Tax=Trichinella spiralis TaxID=6334 RepID=A0ABR3KKF8_TRISP